MSDFDLSGWLGNLFGNNTPTDPTDPTDPTKIGTGATPNSPGVTGWLNKNSGGLSQLGTQFLQMNKPQQMAPLQLNMAAPPRPQVQMPQVTGMLNMPVAPVMVR